jgi:multicomponent Na+:H+ antiporter subunit G
MDTAAGVLAILGASFVLLAGLGALRFPDVYARMHAATKASTLGIGLVGLGTVLAVDAGSSKILIAVAFIFLTAPAAAHLVGRAAYRAEGIEIDLSTHDDLAALMDDPDEAHPEGSGPSSPTEPGRPAT